MGVQINGDTGNVIATKGTYSGNLTIGGTLTYEDVTNIDSVGLITSRTGLEIGARPGVAASISVDGNAIFSGITTVGGSLVIEDKITHLGDSDTTIRFPADDVITFETAGTERFRITGTGNVGVSTGDPTGRFSVGKVGAYLNRDGITVTNPHSSGLKNGVFVLNESGYNGTASYRAAAFKAVGTAGIAVGVSTDQGSNGLGGTLNYSVDFNGKSVQDGSITANGSFYQEEAGQTNGGDTQDKTVTFNARGVFLMLISYSLGTTTTDINRNFYSLGLFTSRSNGATWTAIQQDLNSTQVGNLTISDAGSAGQLRVQKSAGSDNRACAFRIDVLSSANVKITVTDT